MYAIRSYYVPGEGTYDIDRYINAQEPAKKLNVMLITVESLSAKFLSRFGQKHDITPFMDEWFKQGLLFTNFYATGTRTTRGLEAITLSIPPTPGRSIVKRPDNRGVFTLGKVFKDSGYDTACMVRACQRIARFYFKESCGQCTPCREGTGWMYRMLTRIVEKQATLADLEMLRGAAGQIEGHTIS